MQADLRSLATTEFEGSHLDYRNEHKLIVEKVVHHERRKRHKVEVVIEKTSGRTLYFRVRGHSIRVFHSSHKGGIMSEDGIAIPKKVYYELLDEPKPFIRLVSIPEKRFRDYSLGDFNWRPRDETSTMNASLSTKQRRELLYNGEEFTL